MVSEKAWQPWTMCICPKCSKKHKFEIFWSGRGTPRIFCQLCKKKSKGIDDTFLHIGAPRISKINKIKNQSKEE